MRGTERRKEPEMKNINIDNPFFEAMGRLGDIILVNLLLLFCSLPLVTIGAAVSAMYGVYLEMAEGTEGRIGVTFFRYFRKGLKKNTIVWSIMLAVGVLFVFDIFFLGYVGMEGIWKVVGVVTGCLVLIWELLFAWVFAFLANWEGTVRDGAAAAMRMAVLHLPATLIMVVFNNILLICLWMGVFYLAAVIPIYLVAGFGLTGYVNSWFFKKYLLYKENKEEKEKGEAEIL